MHKLCHTQPSPRFQTLLSAVPCIVGCRWERRFSKYDALDWAATMLPCIRWLRGYQWRSSALVRYL